MQAAKEQQLSISNKKNNKERKAIIFNKNTSQATKKMKAASQCAESVRGEFGAARVSQNKNQLEAMINAFALRST